MSVPDNTRKFVQKNSSVILRAIADVTQSVVGEAMGGKHASYVSQFLKGDQKISFDEMIAMLDICGLALHRISEDDIIVSLSKYRCMHEMALQHMLETKI